MPLLTGRRDLAQRLRPTSDANQLSAEAVARGQPEGTHADRAAPASLLRRMISAGRLGDRDVTSYEVTFSV